VFADNVHCDADAFKMGNLFVDCPRAEGRLAKSQGLLTPNDPDSFAAVALVNRFDLTPSDLFGCGEYRIVYAKRSGLSDPGDRALLIFESALDSPASNLSSCRPIAEFLARLDDPSQTESLADRLDHFYFQGISGFQPVIRAQQYGLDQFGCPYGKCGQVRIGQGMQLPWEFRQFRLATSAGNKTPLLFAPIADSSSPSPDLFDARVPGSGGEGFRSLFASSVSELTSSDLATISMTSSGGYDAMESALEGPAKPDYQARAAGSSGQPFREQIALSLERLKLDGCPSDDALTPERILQRASTLTCAGCHAPERALSPERSIGCGQVWPKSLGEAHIDERGRISEALSQVFLPHRADVLATYLQACDPKAVRRNLLPVPERVIVECFVAGTPVTMADGSQKAIEQIVPGESVMSYEETSGALVPGHVERTFVRPEADRLIVINGSLVATSNHAFHTARGWIPAEHLELGDPLIGLDGASTLDVAPARVQELSMRPGGVTTYNLEVAVHHAYFAGGLLVHDGP
jgi:hypothetical protein